ncbi:xanthine dehydrogenase family protein subunit M [Alteromonas sp. ASW11-19]|uniref:Xanthine dehydrogenase family protein subunit M n=1 Tax=Alteromonas salexigens TaxID=2982530 RepID=A0ABT2VJP2_9ALTE|nr:xanthine dehydrogenase family protein subunit M [Alteromonas salexigens]MCU7553462.1 xanthine dehydrogenase family protein subunit M [Alteromonas salexigens]
MKPFSVFSLQHAEDLSQVASFKHSRFLAGGTNLVDLMKHQIERPDHIIDLSGFDEANQITEDDGRVVIGAMVTNTALADYAYKHPRLSLLAQALLAGATVQLRNRASTAGNLLQRTRCYYFYDTSKACNKREPGSGCAAKEGFNRIHAILGTSEHCIATHPSDMATAMVALDARVHICNAAGVRRELPVRELYTLPGDTPHVETQLADDDLITAVSIDTVPRGTHIYQKVRDRSSYAFALVSVACTLRVNEGVIDEVSLALGGVAPRPWHAHQAEACLLGNPPSPELFAQAAEAELKDARSYGGNDYKVPVLRRTLTHVLNQASDHQRAHPSHEGAMYAR